MARGEPKELLRRGHGLRDAARTLLGDHRRTVAGVQEALAPLRKRAAREQLATIPVARIKDVTGGRLRLSVLEGAELDTVQQILDTTPYELQTLPGVGPQTANQVHAAARQIAEAAERAATIRIDPDRRDTAAAELVRALHVLVNAGPDLPRAREAATEADERLSPLLADARPAIGWRRWFTSRTRREQAQAALGELAEALREEEARGTPELIPQASVDLLRPRVSADAAWIDFELRASDYYALLAELAALDPERDGAEGYLPDEISRRVREQPLDETHLRVSLRGYQSFGARFALAQERAILGDEMGLGKTVQAIAAMAHLAAEGATHFLVACPASVLINWMREIDARSALSSHPVHGSDRAKALKEWAFEGGVAVTTLDVLHTLEAPEGVTVAMLVVDEAHYVKNHETRRARAVAAWCARTQRVLFLTGTPMENRVDEFRNLVAHLRPELVPAIRRSDAAMGPRAFRSAVAPAYLRRNQQDVLVELPEVVHVDEWEEFSRADAAAYRQAVASGNFMAMRSAAYADPRRSSKLKRVVELIDEAAANELKVVVFSYFRGVLAAVQSALGERALGPISGDVPPPRRQQLVDDFTAEPGHAVLLAQIQAGGTGLNLQAASVVIICEPQVKPTLETQAIARAHRMGQVRTVQVHRILTTDSVDQRMLDLLRGKDALFDAYARRSDVAEAAPEAVDISERELARQLVEQEQLRLETATG
ncbi:DEAD/DEAH box helicase [Actinomadura barringtoniae]|uniref:DEAD/DEAH box helicase n=1 Tax=Actinomadura barringtoniae TaxID=1427535 RepID=A0A939T294_9ACTN|nr:DEAD/DEAH box helicase [Actinomadura barringtoniae]MBO2446228.1 DEAD/DEAH box helicase [Actinomadura barringtoniae]